MKKTSAKKVVNDESIVDLQGEVETLRERLEEAESTLQAIRNGEVDAVVVSGTDGEQVFTLRGAETPYRILIEQMQEGAVALSLEGIILYSNQRFSEMIGKPLDEVVGSEIITYVAGQEREKLKQVFLTVSKKPIKVEVLFELADGKQMPTFLAASVITEDSSTRIGVVITDLTAQREHEEVLASEKILRTSEARLRELADTMPQIVWGARPDGYCDYYNNRWTEFAGFSDGAIDDERWKFVIHPDDVERTLKSWYEAVRTGNPYELEYRLREKNTGEYFWHLGRALPVRDQNGTIVRWYGTCTNIDGQKKAESERDSLLATERNARNNAEAASRVKDDFLATLSHELRTPLNAMLGYAQLIRKRGIADIEFVKQGLDIIEKNARVQAELIADLLDMSRITSGKLHLEIENVNIALTVEEVTSSMRLAAEAKEIKLGTSIDSIPSVAGDATRLRQIVWNLLSNSIKFTPKGGVVRVRLVQVESHVEIQVTDSGIGISAEFLPHVFSTFQQADASSSRKFGGLGLGLSIVRHLVELHGGTIEALSDGLGTGTTFKVRLPIAAVKTKYEAEQSSAQKELTKKQETNSVTTSAFLNRTFLVVDDEADARSLMHDILTRFGATVHTAGSAKEALAALASLKPDIIISDIGMAEEDGLSLITKVRQLPKDRGGQIPAIALTAFARTEDRRRILMAGFQVHIAKPVDADELVSVITGLLNNPNI